MNLKEENISGKWSYLESHLENISKDYDADQIIITHNNKKYEHLSKNNKLKFLPQQYRYSL